MKTEYKFKKKNVYENKGTCYKKKRKIKVKEDGIIVKHTGL
jgi:hypothetical protein